MAKSFPFRTSIPDTPSLSALIALTNMPLSSAICMGSIGNSLIPHSVRSCSAWRVLAENRSSRAIPNLHSRLHASSFCALPVHPQDLALHPDPLLKEGASFYTLDRPA